MVRERLHGLESIYETILAWSGDAQLARRNLGAIVPDSELAVIGEAVGPRTLRVSGVSYFDEKGRIGRSGSYLDKILKPLGYTVYPPRAVMVSSGLIDCTAGAGRRTAYCTDLYPAFPGYETLRGQQRIRRPSQAQVKSAMEWGFLRTELEIVKPRAILLLGAEAYAQFYHYMLLMSATSSLEAVVARLQDIDLPKYRNALVVPFFHPSPASSKFLQWFQRFGSRLRHSALVKRLARSL
jgi:uracil-DNA glycosylase